MAFTSTSGSNTANGSLPTISRAHQTAWPRPSGLCWRVKLAGAGFRQVGYRAQLVFLLLAALVERGFELELAVEMILDHALVAPGDENEMLDAGLARLVHDVLDQRPVDHGQHFLRHGLGGGQEAGAETGDGKDGFADAVSWVRSEPVPQSVFVNMQREKSCVPRGVGKANRRAVNFPATMIGAP